MFKPFKIAVFPNQTVPPKFFQAFVTGIDGDVVKWEIVREGFFKGYPNRKIAFVKH
jgi:hypothetical protein